jgi:hypothetical protein
MYYSCLKKNKQHGKEKESPIGNETAADVFPFRFDGGFDRLSSYRVLTHLYQLLCKLLVEFNNDFFRE